MKIQGKGYDSKDYMAILEYLKFRGNDKHEALFTSVASNHVENRLPLEVLRHKDINTTTIYTHTEDGLKNPMEKIVQEYIMEEKTFKTFIRENVRLKESPIEKKSILEYDITNNGAIDYNNLMFETWKRLGGKIANE